MNSWLVKQLRISKLELILISPNQNASYDWLGFYAAKTPQLAQAIKLLSYLVQTLIEFVYF